MQFSDKATMLGSGEEKCSQPGFMPHDIPPAYPCNSSTNMNEFNNNNTSGGGSGSDVELGEATGCAGCGGRISDRYFLVAAEKQWHLDCLRCVECKTKLDSELTCFSRDADIYCREDYYRKYAVKTCARCQLPISSHELVMKARDHVYHVTCFACAACHKILTTGEQFGMRDHLIFCKMHYETAEAYLHDDFPSPPISGHMMGEVGGLGPGGGFFPGVSPPHKGRPRKRKNQPSLQEADMFGGHGLEEFGPDGYPLHQPRQKRIRTSFKHHQLRILKSYFALNQNPDAKDLKQLAQKTGLTKRVLQVWFQNARAKYRRNLLKQEQGGGTGAVTGTNNSRHDSSGGPESPANHSDNTETSFSELHDDASQSPRPLQNSDLSATSSLLEMHAGVHHELTDIDREMMSHDHHRPLSTNHMMANAGQGYHMPSSGNLSHSHHQGSSLTELFSSTINAIN